MVINFICKNCGKKFLAEHFSHRTFCSRECMNEYHKMHPEDYKKRGAGNLKEVVCAECGKHEFVSASRAEHYICCSTTCAGEHTRKRASQKIKKTCPICNKEFYVKKSQEKRRVCCSIACAGKYRSIYFCGDKNPNYRGYILENGIKSKSYLRYKEPYRKIVKDILRVKKLPKGYDIHHKDANPNNHSPENLILLPRNVHMLIHRWFGNILINALHTGKITKELFFSLCSPEQTAFYKEIIDLDVLHQEVVKQGELLENPEVGNQQLSVYRNIYESPTTNSRVLPDNAEDGNANTSALLTKNEMI